MALSRLTELSLAVAIAVPLVGVAVFGRAGSFSWNHPRAGFHCDPDSPFDGLDSAWLDVAGRGGQRYVVQPDPSLSVLVDVYDAARVSVGGANGGGAGVAEWGTLSARAALLHVVGYGSAALGASGKMPGPGGVFTARVG